MTYTVTLPGRQNYAMSSNARPHWSVEREVHQYWRGLARLMFNRQPHCERAHLTITFTFPDRRRRDLHNLVHHVVKPIVDGVVDSGVLPDDDDAHLIGPDLRRNPERGPFQVTVTIEPLPYPSTA